MKEIHEILIDCQLFRNINTDEIVHLLSTVNYQVKKYEPGQTIVSNDETCNYLLIVIEGSVKGEMINSSGKTIKIEDIEAPRPIASAFLFGNNNKFPVDVVANTKVSILFLPKESVIKLFQTNKNFLVNFLDLISNRAQFLSKKIKFLSFKTIKGKIANFILSQAGERFNTITVKKSQQELSEMFGVTRPSLSRTLGEMEKEGLIKMDKKDITIVNRQGLMKLMDE